jgi:hypothetical protein
MADFFKNLDKYIKDWHILTFLGLLVLGYVVYEYSGRQNLLVSNYQGVNSQNVAPRVVSSPSTSANAQSAQASGAVLPAGLDALQDNLNGPAQLGQVPSTISPVPTNNMGNQQMIDPSELLPSDSNSAWVTGQSVSPGMSGMNLLDSRNLSIGMQSQTLRNANQQLRSDPVIPAGPAPCFQTTITKEDTGVGLSVC